MARHQYDLTFSAPRKLTSDELERVIRAALDELAAICDIPADAPRTVTRIPISPAAPEKARTV